MQNSGIFQNRFFGNGQKNITLMVKYEDNRLQKKKVWAHNCLIPQKD